MSQQGPGYQVPAQVAGVALVMSKISDLISTVVLLVLFVVALVVATRVSPSLRIFAVAAAIFFALIAISTLAAAVGGRVATAISGVIGALIMFGFAAGLAWVAAALLVPIATAPASELPAYRAARPCPGGRLPAAGDNCTAIVEMTLPPASSSSTTSGRHATELNLTLADGSKHHLQVDDTAISVASGKSTTSPLGGSRATLKVWGRRVPLVTVRGIDLRTSDLPGANVDGGIGAFRIGIAGFALLLAAVGVFALFRTYRKFVNS